MSHTKQSSQPITITLYKNHWCSNDTLKGILLTKEVIFMFEHLFRLFNRQAHDQ